MHNIHCISIFNDLSQIHLNISVSRDSKLVNVYMCKISTFIRLKRSINAFKLISQKGDQDEKKKKYKNAFLYANQGQRMRQI